MIGDGGTRFICTKDRPGGIRVITLDNPPANAISLALSAQLLEAVVAADADPAIAAIIVTGAGGRFSFGADINDFATPWTAETKTARDVIAAIERSDKTFVAAIDGYALGAGLELALACDYRIGSPKAKVGLPEIKIGLLPGAGGTQRLPRLIGVKDALQVMLGGDTIAAADARAKGILDEVVAGDVVEEAAASIERNIAAKPKRRVSARATELGVSGLALFGAQFVIAQAHELAPPEAKGGFAAHKLIDAVEASLELDFARGMAREARLFDELLHSAQSAALQHVFFAERQVGKIPNLPAVEAADIASAGVIGAGTMGTGIAIAFASAGIPVIIVEPAPEQIERSKKVVASTFARQVQRRRLGDEEARKISESISWATGYEALAAIDIVVEAVFENMDLKKQVFAKLDTICKPQAILASNTSTLDVDEMAAATQRPDRFVGMHFFAPANIMKLLEIVRGARTSPQTLTTAVKLAKRLRKVGVVSANAFGFIGNRMFFDYTREAVYLLEEGIPPERIDRVMKDQFGFAMGPFATFDLSGVDVFWHVLQERPDALGEKRTNLFDRMYAAKRWGQKTGRGFYTYDGPDPRVGVPDPDLIALVAEEAQQAGIAPREVADDEIVERLLYALANVGADLLEKDVALRPGDEDMVFITGYGFPPYRGGPMWYADEVGIANVVERIRAFGWPVAPLLERIAQSGGTIADYRRVPAHA